MEECLRVGNTGGAGEDAAGCERMVRWPKVKGFRGEARTNGAGVV